MKHLKLQCSFESCWIIVPPPAEKPVALNWARLMRQYQHHQREWWCQHPKRIGNCQISNQAVRLLTPLPQTTAGTYLEGWRTTAV